MKHLPASSLLFAAASLLTAARVATAAVQIQVRVDQPGAVPSRIGIFFEDINYGADGGLYPERVKNRSFEFTEPLAGWQPALSAGSGGSLTVLGVDPLHPDNPHYLRASNPGPESQCVLVNEGFFGIGVEQRDTFTFSVFGRSPAPGIALGIELLGAEGQVLAREQLTGFTPDWKRHARTLRAAGTDPKASLKLVVTGDGQLDLDLVSLFPKQTWKGRSNGLRPDLVQWLADLRPAFLRFPGGCIVEGRHLATRYQWKTTIGDLTERKLIINRWNDEFKHRPAPDYFQSFGLGFYEYFQLSEDIGAEPMPILNCGMACQFNSGELAPLEDLEPYIQDALDLIEFANGPVSSPWGARRAALGHPRPFHLRMLGIGNEQWGPQYIERYARFARVLKDRHPEVQLVSGAGPRPNDDLYHFLWPKLRELDAEIVDEHCYDRPAWFLDNASRYDGFPRSGPKVFMGEYAAQSVRIASPDNRNNWECALAEAAYLTGLERNSDVVVLSSYAPLLGHEEGWQWRPNLIWFDNLRSYATPNYYVQQMFSTHRGDVVLPVQVAGQPAPSARQPGLYASATYANRPGEVLLKVVNSAPGVRTATIQLQGVSRVGAAGAVTILTSRNLADENSPAHPTRIVPSTAVLHDAGAEFRHSFPAHSLTVLRLPAAR